MTPHSSPALAHAQGFALARAEAAIDLMLDILSDGCDHPELWADMAELSFLYPGLRERIAGRYYAAAPGLCATRLLILHALCAAAEGDLAIARAEIEPLALCHGQQALVQGARAWLHRHPGH
ncbi:MAG TPA: hypothetical protein VFF98_07880 [Novosphingobium sp.]|nr:hypothetical protein [Novosphingobium sp.]